MIDSDLSGPAMRKVAQMQNHLLNLQENAKTAQFNLSKISKEPVDVESEE